MANFELYHWDLVSDEYLVDKKDFAFDAERFSNKQEDFKLRTDLFPEPHMGNLKTAKVVLLALNPGLKITKDNPKYDCEELEWYNEHKNVTSILKDNLKGKLTSFPYYYLNPDISSKSPGHAWLKKRIRGLKEASNLSCEQLSERIACIQYFPYHSAKYKHSKRYLPSQRKPTANPYHFLF